MRKPPSSGPQAKVFYRPIEAAIQWTGLSRFERRILDLARGMNRLPMSVIWSAIRNWIDQGLV
ncbi:hypothetical protein FG99_24795 [Pseudomonas sp. AAC]|jgi:hypothetical protein|nr:hypothetical protein FG99_24795 [Pseudomonas sp. AAC]KRV65490.1 hypothetical protein AO742_24945 [Pseudomonas citronellolis]KSW26440.1 hypothetical protein AOX63_22720 [Pseudomonas sp. ADP]KWR79082.1 hypothetical protein RN02_14995 [Pseudomonas sp. PI1]OBP12909.1 hypothetical protein BAE52_02155 [Pseudomonas sp. EGD-AKN5]OHS12846.1 hypothetical protein HMPREF3289_00640 [Pseudomonas sp. HMSC75E02]